MDLLHTDGAQATFLIDLIASVFAREVERLIGHGLAKGFVDRRFLEPPFPGRIDVAYHLGRLAARPDRMVTVARRITLDILINQVLAYALEILRRVPLSDDVSVRVARLGPSFRRVSHRPVAADEVARTRLTKLSARYADALALAELILRSQEIAPRGAGLSGGSILFNMPKVWENYVIRWVQSEWPTHTVQQAYGFNLTSDGKLRAETDAVVWDSGELVALYDAKYKFPDKAPSRDDVYQMVTYCERLGLAKATLVYPASVKPRTVTVTGKSISVLGIQAPKRPRG
jgi:5-methylcytosine-specific restriction enzyme subunit McrC